MTTRRLALSALFFAVFLAAPCGAQSPLQGGYPAGVHEHRSERAKEQFMRQTGYPHGRPGYVVDHVVPLAEGGADAPSNMQWQTIQDAKAKDKIECGGKRCGSHGGSKSGSHAKKSSGSHHGSHSHR